ncbi:MAG TPA: vitamin K epoxide reductase family protein [Jiangellaceae bacterium]
MSTDMTDDELVSDAEHETEPLEDEIDLDAPTEHQRAGGAHRGLSLLLTIGGVIGFAAALDLLIERIELLKDPSYVPSCSFNPVLSCGSVMETWQAQAFGFPNPIIGVASFAAVTTIGVVLLTGGLLPRWFWLGLQAGTIFGAGFITWLAYQSLYNIEALCPYCMVVWTVMIPIFVYVTAHNVQAGHLPAPVGVRNLLVRNKALIVLAWYLVFATAILIQFWDYWSTLI